MNKWRLQHVRWWERLYWKARQGRLWVISNFTEGHQGRPHWEDTLGTDWVFMRESCRQRDWQVQRPWGQIACPLEHYHSVSVLNIRTLGPSLHMVVSHRHNKISGVTKFLFLLSSTLPIHGWLGSTLITRAFTLRARFWFLVISRTTQECIWHHQPFSP